MGAKSVLECSTSPPALCWKGEKKLNRLRSRGHSVPSSQQGEPCGHGLEGRVGRMEVKSSLRESWSKKAVCKWSFVNTWPRCNYFREQLFCKH